MGKEVLAFEPMPSNLHLLLRNIRDNSFSDQTQVFPLALSDRPGILKIYGSGTGASLVPGWAGTSESFHQLAPISTLDRIVATQVAGRKVFLLIDVEGAEYAVLQGAKQTAKNSPKPTWFVEISLKAHQPRGVTINPNFLKTFEFFWDLGYESFLATNPPVAFPRNDAQDAVSGKKQLTCQNFLFCPSKA